MCAETCRAAGILKGWYVKKIYIFYLLFCQAFIYSVLICLFIYLFVYLFIHLFVCLFIYLLSRVLVYLSVGQFTDDPKLSIAFFWDMTLRQCVIGSQRFEAHSVISISTIIIMILMTLRALKR